MIFLVGCFKKGRSRPRLTRRVIVADGVPGGEGQDTASWALDSGTSNLGRALPDNLGEVSEVAKGLAAGRVLSAV